MGSMWYKTVAFDTLTNGDGDFVFLDERSAIELFRPLEELKNSCTRICFGSHIFGVEAALVAQRALMDVRKTLKEVEFVHFIFGRSEDEAIKVMRIFSSALEGCTLTSLTLELGELGEKAVIEFAPLLKAQKTLENLKFISNSISFEAAEAIFKLLPSIEWIENLYFIYNQKADDLAEALSELFKKCIALEDANSSKNNFGICGAFDVEEYFGEGTSPRMLDFEGPFGEGNSLNMLDSEFDTCGVVLRQVICGYVVLADVGLSNMNLQDERVIDIARCLKSTAPFLRILTVGGNNITPRAAPALAECLAVKNLLTIFSAGRNKLKDDGAVVICKAISEGHELLEELDLSGNGMTGIGAKAAAEAVAKKPYFSCLQICKNFITKKGIATVKDVLRNGTNGESVLGHIYQYKDVGGVRYEFKEEGLTDSDTESEEKLKKP